MTVEMIKDMNVEILMLVVMAQVIMLLVTVMVAIEAHRLVLVEVLLEPMEAILQDALVLLVMSFVNEGRTKEENFSMGHLMDLCCAVVPCLVLSR